MSEVAQQRPGYEHSDISAWLLASLAGGLAIFLLASPYLLGLIYPNALHPAGAGAIPSPPPPRLQTHVSAELATLRAAETAQLSGYAWADRPAGTVRIPIDRALALIAERGLPDWPKP